MAASNERPFRSPIPNMTELASESPSSDPDERFEMVIDIFVDGLARRAAAGA